MGVSISQIVQGREINLEDLFDKKIAIDSYNWLYQFLSIIRQADGTPLKDSKGRVTSHFSGLYYRTLKLLEAGIKPIYVFDGKPVEMKKETTEQRRSVRAEAKDEWKRALERGDLESAKKYAQRSTTVTEEIVDGSKQLLDAMGIPYIQAPNEGEALCSVMCKNNDVFATSSQDYDVLLFGSPRLVRNLSISGRKKRGSEYVTINPEMIILRDALNTLSLTQEQMIILGILVGTDYNPGGIPGYGPKKALQIVKENKSLEKVFKDLAWNFPATPEEIFDFFTSPKEIKYDIKFRDIDEEKVLGLLCDEHEFSVERIENALKKLKENKKKQSSLSRWI
ncbi:flap endonuclease-1 [archaeon]|nr:flap endonuclease-1 [archaeon]